MLERSIAPFIIREFGSSGIVYDQSAIRCYGSENDLARYNHYYNTNGENREINFVLAVTRKVGCLWIIIPPSGEHIIHHYHKHIHQ
ncbi:MAG: hypothetical protein QW292_13325 [Candidatus Parvarchaeota archaeon]